MQQVNRLTCYHDANPAFSAFHIFEIRFFFQYNNTSYLQAENRPFAKSTHHIQCSTRGSSVTPTLLEVQGGERLREEDAYTAGGFVFYWPTVLPVHSRAPPRTNLDAFEAYGRRGLVSLLCARAKVGITVVLAKREGNGFTSQPRKEMKEARGEKILRRLVSCAKDGFIPTGVRFEDFFNIYIQCCQDVTIVTVSVTINFCVTEKMRHLGDMKYASLFLKCVTIRFSK